MSSDKTKQDEFFSQFGTNASEHVFVGLKDGGHNILRCSNCNAKIADCWVTKPDEKDPITNKVVVWKVRARCPYCVNEYSYWKDIKGRITPGGFGEGDIEHTKLDDFDMDYEKQTVTIITAKAGDGKPRK